MAEAVATGSAPEVVGLNHMARGSPDVNRLADFYKEIFGFEEVERPNFGDGVKVIILDLPSAFNLHLIERNSTMKIPEGPWTYASRDPSHIHFGYHTCFTVSNFDFIIQTLKEKGIEFFEIGPKPKSRKRQAFFFDPDGNGLEIISEETPEQ